MPAESFSLSILVPVYNESAAILQTLSEIHQTMQKTPYPYEIIVINDGSTDHTVELLKTAINIKLLSHPVNKGYGFSLTKGLRHAQYPWIAIADADGTYPVQKIPEMIPFTDTADMVVGSRTGKNVHIPANRKPAKKCLQWLAEYLMNQKIPDLNSGLRIFRKDQAMEFIRLYPEGFSFTTTITLSFLSSGYPVHYFPIDYYPRKGTSKISPIKDTRNFIFTIVRTVLYFNPLKVCLPLGFFFFLLSVLFFLESWFFEAKIRDASVIILLMTAFQCCAIGFLADLINRRSK